MKKTLLILLIFTLGFNYVYADQLAYISKSEAEQAAKLIKGKHVILFCGCCSNDAPVKVKVLKTEVKYTGYEDFYEVIITYKNAAGETVGESIDLAYVWVKSKKTTKTVGSVLGLEHDPCSEALDWKAYPKN
jgi:hypothetical protein